MEHPGRTEAVADYLGGLSSDNSDTDLQTCFEYQADFAKREEDERHWKSAISSVSYENIFGDLFVTVLYREKQATKILNEEERKKHVNKEIRFILAEDGTIKEQKIKKK